MFPINKRNQENFTTFFQERGLGAIANMQIAQMASKAKKEAQKCLADMIKDESPVSEVGGIHLLWNLADVVLVQYQDVGGIHLVCRCTLYICKTSARLFYLFTSDSVIIQIVRVLKRAC